MITEINHKLTQDERNDLLFLTGGLKVFNTKDLDENSRWNINEYFGYNRNSSVKLLKVIIKHEEVITKIWT